MWHQRGCGTGSGRDQERHEKDDCSDHYASDCARKEAGVQDQERGHFYVVMREEALSTWSSRVSNSKFGSI